MEKALASLGTFLKELRQRRVFHVAAVYGVVGWILVQVAQTSFPALHLPPWTGTFVVVFVIIGFPFAMILAWARELTPDAASPAESSIAERACSSTSQPSVAVLPFHDMSPERDQDFFCEGISEEIINALTHVEGMRIIARTSAFAFKEKSEDIREIGKKLDVDSVLEGSVRKSGNQLRITAQLIRVSDGSHLWSENYDREMEDVFAVQDDISLAVVDVLSVKLLGKERRAMGRNRADNVEAYELYLRGTSFWNRRSESGYRKGVEFFERALARDPLYGLAHTGFAKCHVALGLYFDDPKVAFRKAKEAAERALEIDETNSEAFSALGAISAWNSDWPDADRKIRRAIELNPKSVYAHHAAATLWPAKGRHDEALDEAERALELDPLSLNINSVLGLVHYCAGRYDDAIRQFLETLAMDPEFQHSLMFLGLAYGAESRHGDSINTLQRLAALSGNNPVSVGLLGNAYGLAGRRAEAIKMLERLQELEGDRYVSPWYQALIHTGIGDVDKAIALLIERYAEGGYFSIFLGDWPIFDPIRSHPKFNFLVKHLKLRKRQ